MCNKNPSHIEEGASYTSLSNKINLDNKKSEDDCLATYKL